jgi:hypothetical protein
MNFKKNNFSITLFKEINIIMALGTGHFRVNYRFFLVDKLRNFIFFLFFNESL